MRFAPRLSQNTGYQSVVSVRGENIWYTV